MIKSYSEFLNESINGRVLLVRVDQPKESEKKFLYAFTVPATTTFKKGKGELTMVHLNKDWPCWRIMRDTDTGGFRCSKAIWPRKLTGQHLVINDNKTPLHWRSLDYSDPHAFVREFETALEKEANIEYR
jgi:hypothetical protein